MNEKITNEPRTGFERHFQTILQTCIILILAWYGNKTIDTSDTVIRLEEKIIAMQATLTKATSDRFRGADAKAMQAIFESKFDSHDRRITNLERYNKAER